jgi:CheY-like chemotaxis protein
VHRRKDTTVSLHLPATDSAPHGGAMRPESIDQSRARVSGSWLSMTSRNSEKSPRCNAYAHRAIQGCTVYASGEAAVDYVKANPVDLVVLDMIMDPGIDGLETYRRIIQITPANVH